MDGENNGKPYSNGWFGGKTHYFWKHPNKVSGCGTFLVASSFTVAFACAAWSLGRKTYKVSGSHPIHSSSRYFFFALNLLVGFFRHRYFCFESNGILVGGLTNPFEKYARQIGLIFPKLGWTWKKIWNNHAGSCCKVRWKEQIMEVTTTIHVCLVVQCIPPEKKMVGNCQLEARNDRTFHRIYPGWWFQPIWKYE